LSFPLDHQFHGTCFRVLVFLFEEHLVALAGYFLHPDSPAAPKALDSSPVLFVPEAGADHPGKLTQLASDRAMRVFTWALFIIAVEPSPFLGFLGRSVRLLGSRLGSLSLSGPLSKVVESLGGIFQGFDQAIAVPGENAQEGLMFLGQGPGRVNRVVASC